MTVDAGLSSGKIICCGFLGKFISGRAMGGVLDQSFLPMLADQPPPRHFFAKGFQTIAVTDPILIQLF